MLGLRSDGGYAELISVPAENLIPIPAHIDFVTAAAFPLTFLTAWHMLITRAGVREGDVVLVLAGGSGVGQAAIQLAQALRRSRLRDVSAREGGPDPRARRRTGVRSLRGGFLETATPDDRRTRRRHRHRTRRRGDLGPQRARARDGRPAGDVRRDDRLRRAPIDLRHLFARQLSLLGSYMGRFSELRAAAPLLFDGRVTPVIDEVFPLARAADAQRRLEHKGQFGKIVLAID